MLHVKHTTKLNSKMGPFRVLTKTMSKALALNVWLRIKHKCCCWPQQRAVVERCQNGMVIWTGNQILSNPATSVRPLALAVLFDAGLAEAVLSSIVREFLSHLNGDGKEVLFRYSQLYSKWCTTAQWLEQAMGLRSCLPALPLTLCEQPHPLTCQQVHFSISKVKAMFCFLEIKLNLKGILTSLNEKVYVVDRLDRL